MRHDKISARMPSLMLQIRYQRFSWHRGVLLLAVVFVVHSNADDLVHADDGSSKINLRPGNPELWLVGNQPTGKGIEMFTAFVTSILKQLTHETLPMYGCGTGQPITL